MLIREPSVLAQLPSPVGSGLPENTYVSQVYGLQKAQKRKRFEVAVAVDGEAVLIYNVFVRRSCRGLAKDYHRYNLLSCCLRMLFLHKQSLHVNHAQFVFVARTTALSGGLFAQFSDPNMRYTHFQILLRYKYLPVEGLNSAI